MLCMHHTTAASHVEFHQADAHFAIVQAPFTKDTMDKMFTKAAKLLPANIQKIYGGDGGQWVGLKVRERTRDTSKQ